MARESAVRADGQIPVASLGYTPRDASGTVLHQVVRVLVITEKRRNLAFGS